ncbi:DUF1214 domain-containing protein [Streptomyces sp. NPDC059092]|uniref:DUF1214 domain-containing protein n=1 Tax=Streptomyces sp. NPDC059092 TaxID=3346725 RepID=UPI0036B5A4C1
MAGRYSAAPSGSPASHVRAENEPMAAVPAVPFAGDLPEGVTRVDCPTDLALLMIRIREFTDVDDNDYATVDALQKRLDIRPLSAYEDADYVPPASTVNPDYDYDPYARKASIALVDFFNSYNRLTVDNPVEDAYKHLAAGFEKYDIGAGKTFTLDGFDADLTERLEAIPQDFESGFPQYFAQYSYTEDGWITVDGDALEAGGDYHVRNTYYYYQPPSVNPPQVFKGYGTVTDSEGNTLDGGSTYRVRFEKDSMSPFKTGGFWCLIAYWDTQMNIPENSIGRYKLDELSLLEANEDGTTDICLPSDAPTGTPENNWLPTAGGSFLYVLRIYAPDDSALSGDWKPPRLEKIG